MVNLTSIDFNGSIVGFLYNGERRYKSSMGGLLSIFMIIGLIIVAIIYLQEYFKRKNPKMSFENMKYSNPPQMDISTDFNFTILMKYNGTTQFRNEAIKVEAIHILKNYSHISITPLSTIPCQQNIDDNQNLFDTYELSKGLCFNLSNLSLEGTSANNIFQLIQIKFMLCLNQNECLPIDNMEKLFEDFKPVAFIFFSDTIFQIHNQDQRETTFYNYIDVNVTFNDAKETNLFFARNELLIDDSYLFPSKPKNYSAYMIDSYRDLVSVRTEKQNDSLTLNLLLSKNKEIIHVSYMKISELLASISALGNIIMILFSTIGDYFNHYLFQSDLMQALYHFNSNDKAQKISNNISFQKQNSSLRGSDYTNQKIHNNVTYKDTLHYSHFYKPPNAQSKQFQNTYNDQKSKKRSNHIFKDVSKQSGTICRRLNTKKTETIVIHSKDIIKLVFSKVFPIFFSKQFKRTKELYNIVNTRLIIYQDQKNIFRKLQEIDFMKYLLLTEEQLALYQINTKPEFKINTSAKDSNQHNFSSVYNKDSFHYLKNKKNKDDNISEKVINELLIKGSTSKDNINDIYTKLIQCLN